MVENPNTWGLAERLIAAEMEQAQADVEAGLCGASIERRIVNVLRSAGLLVDAKSPLQSKKD